VRRERFANVVFMTAPFLQKINHQHNQS